ncbi:MAG: DUF1525 domain-containing protein [Chloroflexi bacterium]|nr:DUF1525 domain-containing protein [Chloroflexota bacterium]
MKPLTVQVVAYAPTQYFHCQHCEVVFQEVGVDGVKKFHDDAVESSMPPDMLQDYRELSDWVLRSAEHYGGRVVFKVIDAASMEGVLKSVRYGVRRYPAVVVDGKAVQTGTDFKRAEELIDQSLALQPARPHSD